MFSTLAQTGFSRIFIRRNSCTTFSYSHCIKFGGFDISFGEVVPIYCPSPNTLDEFIEIATITGTESRGTANLGSYLSIDEYTLLEQLFHAQCSFDLIVAFGECSIPTDLTTFRKIIVFQDARLTSYSLSSLTATSPDERAVVEETAAISIGSTYSYIKPNANHTILTTELRGPAVTVTAVCSNSVCDQNGICTTALTSSTYFSLHCQQDIDECSTSMLLRYSTNSGVTWNNVTLEGVISSTNAHIETDGTNLFIVVDDQFYIYKISQLSGVTSINEPFCWVDLDGEIVLTTHYNGEHFYFSTLNFTIYQVDANCNYTDISPPLGNNITAIDGIDGELIIGTTGGEILTYDGFNWTTQTTPTTSAITSFIYNSTTNFLVATCTDGVYKTCDGTTFTSSTISTNVQGIYAVDDIVSYAIVNTATGSQIFVSIDGGFTWCSLSDDPYISDELTGIQILDFVSCASDPTTFVAVGYQGDKIVCNTNPDCSYLLPGVEIIGRV